MDVGDILLSLFAVVVLTASFLSNLIVVICYVYSSEIRRHVPSVFTINLTLCNLVMTLFNMPITLAGIIVPGEFMLGERLCFAHGFMETFLMSNVMLSMAALSLDRWIAVVFPLSYNTKMSYKDATAIMLYSWLHSLTFPVVAVCLKWFDYSPVLKVARFHCKRIDIITMQTLVLLVDIHPSVKQRCLVEQKKRRQRATRKVSTFIGTFVLCFSPYVITRLVELFPSVTLDHHWMLFCKCLAYSKAALDPFVYSLLRRQYKRVWVKLLDKFLRREPNSGHTSSQETDNDSDVLQISEVLSHVVL
uniref:G protein-coupled receptor 26 n=1 Tax=Eptatretus burgeri TaxID=7764 RepID=A0A8C4NBW0_EPTBU